MESVKIVCISASQIPSNTANSIQVMKVCQALAQIGHEVTLVVPGNPHSTISNLQLASHYGLRTPFKVIWLLARDRRLFTWNAVRLARRLGAEALYVWPLQSAVIGLLANFPVILEMNDLPTGVLGPIWYRWFLHLRGSKRLLLITDALRRTLQQEYKLSLAKQDVVIAPNGVDLEQFASLPDPVTARRQIGLPEAQTIICTGHLYAGRGADLFLALAVDFPQTRFLWVGGLPSDVAGWRSRAVAQGLENVNFIGFIPNERLPLYQAAADILLMPYGRIIAISSGVGRSADISSPMKMFEYMAAGRAILASDLPVIHEVLDETAAVFCPPEDTRVWSIALGELLASPSRRQALGQHARTKAKDYTWIERARRATFGFEVQGNE